MSYIQFESAREKDKARQELRDAREQMLKEAKKRAEQRAEREAKRCLKGETNWMLPSVEEKLMSQCKEIKKSKRKKEKKKKSKKQAGKKRKYSSSDTDSTSSGSDSSSECDSNSSSSEEGRKKREKSKNNKKKSKKTKKNKKATERHIEEIEKDVYKNVNSTSEPLSRDSWMTSPLMLKTYRNENMERKPNENQQIDAYDPTKSSRELNPYWKTTGTGLPAFRKPKEDDEDDIQTKMLTTSFSSRMHSTKSWMKQYDGKALAIDTPPLQKSRSAILVNNNESCSEDHSIEYNRKAKATAVSEFLNDQQMNELGAKALKAELMGNVSLANELRVQLENARKQRNSFKEHQQQLSIEGKSKHCNTKGNKREEHIILTHTDQSGNTRPLPATRAMDPSELYSGKRKKKQKAVKTHNELGERVRYFADDDRYSIKEMFEREKYKSASEANLEFANIASKNKNPNDDMEDIFAEKICVDDSSRSNGKDRARAIREHQQIEATLNNCTKCLDSAEMQKERLVCVGEKVYLALPWYQGLQDYHCMIIPNHHVACCTQIDEDTWTEINEFRKALTRMFSAQRKDLIFFEIANRLHKQPHLVIHCIPISESDGEMAPFYFKKAIEESEHEWCINKQLVSLRNKSLRSCIPKGLPYFWVNFGMDTGFAHVIEDQERFPANFAEEIIGGMLNLDVKKWRKLQKEKNIITKVKRFADFWKKYDCTKS